MLEQSYYGIPTHQLAIIIAAVIALIYVLLLKRRVAVYSEDFEAAIDEFNNGCNPGHPMSDYEWNSFYSTHEKDIEHAKKVSTSQLIAFLVKDLSNANKLVDIFDNHKRYQDEAKKKNDKIRFFEQNFQYYMNAKVKMFNNQHYIAHSDAKALKESSQKVLDAAGFCIRNHLQKYMKHSQECLDLCNFMPHIEDHRIQHNANFIKSELRRCSDYFDRILAFPLDPQQRNAIVNGEDNCLVVSSAGSGKTSTIQGKVRYLVDRWNVDPDDILVITYTRKAAEELRKRIGLDDLRCVTFHKLAYDIISEVESKPTICNESFNTMIFYKLRKDHEFVKAVTEYMLKHLCRIKDPFLYETKEEYYTDVKRYGNRGYFTDMDGNIISTKSEQERKISHWLFTHSVNFRYEENYEHNTKTKKHRQYQPDFSIYYTKNGEPCRLYLEHFGINKEGNVPHWFADGIENKTWEDSNREYNDGIRWKRATHARYGTDLIETTSAMFTDGTWESVLKRQLERYGVPMRKKTPEEIFSAIVQKDKHKEETILQLISSFISLLKANCKSISSLMEEAESMNDHRNMFIIDKIIKPYFETYQSTLREKEQIDFTDAILHATDLCNNNRYPKKYQYIIIDEFQDISFDRYKLLLSIRKQSPLGRIFAVGDDWQSIYRFSGSDMGLFAEFPKYFGYTTQCKIETTYRFAQPTIDISSEFIQQNECQVKKTVKSPNSYLSTTIKFKGYINSDSLVTSVYEYVQQLPKDKTVTIISRYSFDFAVFKEPPLLFHDRPNFHYKETDKNIEITIGNRKIRCLTVHQAKGLEADYIILLKCNSEIYGFPSLIADDPVLEYVLSKHEDNIDFAEERRLFYVAITRAKINTTIFYYKNNASPFVNEIAKDGELDDDVFKKCPYCGYGHLRIAKESYAQNGSYFVVIGCSCYGETRCNYSKMVFFNNEPTKEEIEKLVLADPESLDKEIEIERPPKPVKPKIERPKLPDWLIDSLNIE